MVRPNVTVLPLATLMERYRDPVEQWDTEARAAHVGHLEMHLARTSMYLPSLTKNIMDLVYGAPVTDIRTRTFVSTGKVWIEPSKSSIRGVRKLRISKSMGAALFGFSVPLRKLGIKLPEDRQINFPVTVLEVEEDANPKKIVFEISFADIENLPRHLDEAKLATKRAAKVAKMRARRASTKAAKAAEAPIFAASEAKE